MISKTSLSVSKTVCRKENQLIKCNSDKFVMPCVGF